MLSKDLYEELVQRIQELEAKRPKAKYSRSIIPEPTVSEPSAKDEQDNEPQDGRITKIVKELRKRFFAHEEKPAPPTMPPYVAEIYRLLNIRSLTNAEFYKKAHIDRRLFSKICSDYNYHPGRNTVFLMCLAFEFSPEEMHNFLQLFGYSYLSYNKTDIIINYFCEKGIYDIDVCNQTLLSFNQRPLEKLPENP